jgi:hypothetical protein
MCEQMGWEPKEEEIPKDPSFLPYECQEALMLFNILPDRVEGMSGTWLGKDLNSLSSIMDIYEIENKRDVLEYLLVIQRVYSEHYAQQQKMRESRAKSKGRR